MPIGKIYRVRKRRSTRRKFRIPRSLRSPMPKMLKTKLIYSETSYVDAGIATPGVYVFSANGLYDPNITAAGHQPRGFDQIMQLYDHYVVIGAKLTVHCGPQPSVDSYARMCGIALFDNATAKTNVTDYYEAGTKSKLKQCLAENPLPVTVSLKCNPNKYLGRSKPMADPDLKGSDSSNPTEQCYFHFFSDALQGVDSGALYFNALVEYTAVFIEPKQPTES